jgi:hypothetical protein
MVLGGRGYRILGFILIILRISNNICIMRRTKQDKKPKAEINFTQRAFVGQLKTNHLLQYFMENVLLLRASTEQQYLHSISIHKPIFSEQSLNN